MFSVDMISAEHHKSLPFLLRLSFYINHFIVSKIENSIALPNSVDMYV